MIAYTLKRNRRSRSVRVLINCDASVTVTAPWFVSKRRIEKFLFEKKEWIEEKILIFQNRLESLPKKKVLLVPSVARTKKLIKERLEWYNKFYNFTYNRIAIKNTKTKWGSCSSQKNLNFHASLFHLPLELVDYVVVHELCHLQEMNHSAEFWQLVAEQVPDYVSRRKQLKHYSLV